MTNNNSPRYNHWEMQRCTYTRIKKDLENIRPAEAVSLRFRGIIAVE